MSGVVRLLKWIVGRLVDRSDLALQAFGVGGALKLLMLAGTSRNPRILRRFGASVGEHCMIHSPLLLHNAEQGFGRLAVGDRCHIGKDVFIDLAERVTLEDRVTISMRATLLTHFDVGQSPLKDQGQVPSVSPIVVRTGAYIGAGAIILAGVEIGSCAMVAAGAVVTRDVPAQCLVAGVPARVLRSLEPAGAR
ncbi:MAG: acyltransferase [Acidobacteria bacterium]|nr:acyltransferase [Acidobacteriota bacterium]